MNAYVVVSRQKKVFVYADYEGVARKVGADILKDSEVTISFNIVLSMLLGNLFEEVDKSYRTKYEAWYVDASSVNFSDFHIDDLKILPFVPYMTRDEKIDSLLDE